ncbi:MAG: hypothetical protein K6B44_00260 [Lachnospiraceae bacterium]|nr:hypothetical protein [Lachnospiraceae bacterium]
MGRTEKGTDNKGITLLEILVSVCLLAIVLMPISSCMLTSLKINLKARALMTATDVGQSLMEDFTEKSFQEVLSTMNNLSGADKTRATKQIGFSAIDNDYYNKSANVTALSFPSTVTSVTNASISVGGTAYFNKNLVNNAHLLNDQFKAIMKSAIAADSTMKKLVFASDSDSKMLYMGYTGLSSKGKTFDVVITFLPVALNNSDSWYSYEIFMDIYEYKGNSERLGDKATASLKTGIRAKDSL